MIKEDILISAEKVLRLKELGFNFDNIRTLLYWSKCYEYKSELEWENSPEDEFDGHWWLSFHDDIMRNNVYNAIPALTFQDIWACLPKKIIKDDIEYELKIYEDKELNYIQYVDKFYSRVYVEKSDKNINEAAFEVLCFCLIYNFI